MEDKIYPCTGACLFGKCKNKTCVRHLLKQRDAVRLDAEMNILTAGRLPDLKSDKTGYGAAVDIGTTTVVAYLYDCGKAIQLGAASRINSQASLGVDVISRIKYCSDFENGLQTLNSAIISDINSLLEELAKSQGISADDVRHIVVTGNTTMLHLFAGISPVSMGVLPFKPESLFGAYYDSGKLGLFAKHSKVYLMPCISAFVGGDITAAILASGLYKENELCALLDIGTNGEVALGSSDFLYVTSTAAGPAFEGAQISCGMAGVPGAINRVYPYNGAIEVTTIGDKPAQGICGSGLLDAVALMVSSGLVDETGRIDESEAMSRYIVESDGQPGIEIGPGIIITQKDIREIQTAKAAIAAGLEALLHHAGKTMEDISKIYLAGGFGNFMDPGSAIKVGLLPRQAVGSIRAIGNAAGTGAIMALLSDEYKQTCEEIAKTGRHVELGSNPVFFERYIENMYFKS
jgi:uncharacterized 2Fe-2S/4Fe-4S cluster protein (DUF4445 family)